MLEGAVKTKGPVASQVKSLIHVSVVIAHKGECVGEAETEPEGQHSGVPIRQTQTHGVRMGKSAIAGACEVSRRVQGTGKAHREVADEAKVVGEIPPPDKVEVTDELKVVDDIAGVGIDAGEVPSHITGSVTSAGVGQVAGEVAGEIEVAGEVASTSEVDS
jgi:hypothetical protein